MENIPKGYKKTKVGIIPEEWEVVEINDLTNVETGKTPPKSNSIFWQNGTINWVTTKEVNNIYITYSSQKITPIAVEKLKLKIFPVNTILIAMYGQGKTRGKVALLKIRSTINQAFASIKPNKNYSTYYIFSYLNKSYMKIRNLSNSGNQENLNLNIIKSIKIPLPPLPEQKKIAKILITWDRAIEKLKALIREKERLKKGLMQRVLSGKVRFKEFKEEWKEVRLGEVAKIYDGTHQTPKYTQEGIAFYSVENVTSNNFKNTKYISKEDFEKEIKRVRLEKKDILLTRIGDIGTSKYIDWDVEASFYVSLAVIKHSNKFNSKYLKYFFDSKFFQKELHNRTLHIAFPKKINLGEISKCKFFLPPLPEQQKIAKLLTTADKEIELLKRELEALEEQKKGLMQKLLTGEIRVKGD